MPRAESVSVLYFLPLFFIKNLFLNFVNKHFKLCQKKLSNLSRSHQMFLTSLNYFFKKFDLFFLSHHLSCKRFHRISKLFCVCAVFLLKTSLFIAFFSFAHVFKITLQRWDRADKKRLFPRDRLNGWKMKRRKETNIVTRWDVSSSSFTMSLLKAAIYLIRVSLLAFFFVCRALNC